MKAKTMAVNNSIFKAAFDKQLKTVKPVGKAHGTAISERSSKVATAVAIGAGTILGSVVGYTKGLWS